MNDILNHLEITKVKTKEILGDVLFKQDSVFHSKDLKRFSFFNAQW